MIKKYLFLFIWAISIFLITVIYFLFIKNQIENIFLSNSLSSLSDLIEFIYPRFIIERERFEPGFFIKKADQVVLRFVLINVTLFLLYYLLKKSHKFKRKWIIFWNQEASTFNLNFFINAFYLGLFAFSIDWYWGFEKMVQLNIFYHPLLLFKFLGNSYPSLLLLQSLCVLLYLFCFLILFRYKTVLFSISACFLFILLQSFLYGFEKTDQTFAIFNYLAMLMPFLIFFFKTDKGEDKKNRKSTFLVLIKIIIGLCYFQAGLEKILISNLNWFSASTLQHHLLTHPTQFGLWVSQFEWLCILLQTASLLFEIGFITIVFFPKMKYVFLPVGILFHLSTFWLMGIGGWFNSWIFAYMFFIDWEKIIYQKFKFSKATITIK